MTNKQFIEESKDSQTKMADCPLCKIPLKEVLVDFDRWSLVRAKNLKGHRERLMLVSKRHSKQLDEGSIGEAYLLLNCIGQRFFGYADEWAIFESDFATIPDHWHRIASDLDVNADDFQQILKTSRTIISNRGKKISRVFPDAKIRSRNPAEDSIA
jgi:hypothetical protein